MLLCILIFCRTSLLLKQVLICFRPSKKKTADTYFNFSTVEIRYANSIWVYMKNRPTAPKPSSEFYIKIDEGCQTLL